MQLKLLDIGGYAGSGGLQRNLRASYKIRQAAVLTLSKSTLSYLPKGHEYTRVREKWLFNNVGDDSIQNSSNMKSGQVIRQKHDSADARSHPLICATSWGLKSNVNLGHREIQSSPYLRGGTIQEPRVDAKVWVALNSLIPYFLLYMPN